jgi:hypothetical protein
LVFRRNWHLLFSAFFTKEKRGNKNKKTFAFSIGLLLETEKKSNNFSHG